jgi:enamine deaminase RidA (YjgF/YER057c/UK114 family)
MKRESIQTAAPWEPIVGYSRAIKVGPYIAVTGTSALDAEGRLVGEGDTAAQTRQCLANIAAALGRLGARMEDVVRTRIYVTDIREWEAVGRAEARSSARFRTARRPPWCRWPRSSIRACASRSRPTRSW